MNSNIYDGRVSDAISITIQVVTDGGAGTGDGGRGSDAPLPYGFEPKRVQCFPLAARFPGKNTRESNTVSVVCSKRDRKIKQYVFFALHHLTLKTLETFKIRSALSPNFNLFYCKYFSSILFNVHVFIILCVLFSIFIIYFFFFCGKLMSYLRTIVLSNI